MGREARRGKKPCCAIGKFQERDPHGPRSIAIGHPDSIASLPHGIEVQVLDLGDAEIYTKQYNKPADGYCTLRQGDTVVWKRRCLAKTDTSITLERDLVHELEGDVLHIEGQYQARRR